MLETAVTPSPASKRVAICAAVLAATSWIALQAQSLYDPLPGTLPEAQGWSYLAIGTAAESFLDRSAALDTSKAIATHAGWAQVASEALDRSTGFTLLFSFRLNSETHNNPHRAGFSLILLGNDAHGVELGFWEQTVFAQADSPLFTHAEDTSISATNTFVDYALTIRGDQYFLRANDLAILSGPVRDYTAFDGIPNPYRTPNFLFLGDDTGSAGASVEVRQIVLLRPPRLTSLAAGSISWTGVSNQVYRVEASADLFSWAPLGTAVSSDNHLQFLSSPATPKQFYRVVLP